MRRIDLEGVEMSGGGPAVVSAQNIGNAGYGSVTTADNNVPDPAIVYTPVTDFSLIQTDYGANLFGRVSTTPPIANYSSAFETGSSEPSTLVARVVAFIKGLFGG